MKHIFKSIRMPVMAFCLSSLAPIPAVLAAPFETILCELMMREVGESSPLTLELRTTLNDKSAVGALIMQLMVERLNVTLEGFQNGATSGSLMVTVRSLEQIGILTRFVLKNRASFADVEILDANAASATSSVVAPAPAVAQPAPTSAPLPTSVSTTTSIAPNEFVTAAIAGAGIGDSTFSNITLNDRYAVLKTGSFESYDHFYSVTQVPGGYALTPVKAPGTVLGQPIRIRLKDPSQTGSLVAILSRPNQGIEIEGSPSEPGRFEAVGFNRETIDLPTAWTANVAVAHPAPQAAPAPTPVPAQAPAVNELPPQPPVLTVRERFTSYSQEQAMRDLIYRSEFGKLLRRIVAGPGRNPDRLSLNDIYTTLNERNPAFLEMLVDRYPAIRDEYAMIQKLYGEFTEQAIQDLAQAPYRVNWPRQPISAHKLELLMNAVVKPNLGALEANNRHVSEDQLQRLGLPDVEQLSVSNRQPVIQNFLDPQNRSQEASMQEYYERNIRDAAIKLVTAPYAVQILVSKNYRFLLGGLDGTEKETLMHHFVHQGLQKMTVDETSDPDHIIVSGIVDRANLYYGIGSASNFFTESGAVRSVRLSGFSEPKNSSKKEETSFKIRVAYNGFVQGAEEAISAALRSQGVENIESEILASYGGGSYFIFGQLPGRLATTQFIQSIFGFNGEIFKVELVYSTGDMGSTRSYAFIQRSRVRQAPQGSGW